MDALEVRYFRSISCAATIVGFLLAPAASAVIAFLTRYVFFMTESLDLWNEYWAMVLREKSESEISAQSEPRTFGGIGSGSFLVLR